MRLEHICLERLSISTANMRAKKISDIEAILPSVRERGILVPLLVRPNGEPDGYEIVAGRRRFLAAKTIAEERGTFDPLPCAIMEAGDDAAALEASLIENVARLDPDEVTQWETFSRLAKEGRSVEDIASTFGLAHCVVKRILALGNLLPRIRQLYRKDLIDAATVRQLTLATKAQQRAWLTLYHSTDAYAPTGRALKEWLFGGDAIPTTAALFDVTLYPAPIVTDLFGEESYFADPEAFWTLQRQAIDAKRQEYLDVGWNAVELLEPNTRFEPWEFEKLGRSKGGRVYIAISARGEVDIHEGYLPRKETRRQEPHVEQLAPKRPELTSALCTYIDLHRHSAVRAKLLEHPGVALRLAIAHLLGGAPLWGVRADPRRADRASIAESLDASLSEALLARNRRTALELLGADTESSTILGAYLPGTTALLKRLLVLSDEQVLWILGLATGESLQVGSDAVEAVGVHLGVDMAAAWQADTAFFELIRDKEVLTAIVAETAGMEAAAANTGEKGAVLKAIIRDALAGANGRAKVEGWVPRWLRFPASGYTARGQTSSAESGIE